MSTNLLRHESPAGGGERDVVTYADALSRMRTGRNGGWLRDARKYVSFARQASWRIFLSFAFDLKNKKKTGKKRKTLCIYNPG